MLRIHSRACKYDKIPISCLFARNRVGFFVSPKPYGVLHCTGSQCARNFRRTRPANVGSIRFLSDSIKNKKNTYGRHTKLTTSFRLCIRASASPKHAKLVSDKSRSCRFRQVACTIRDNIVQGVRYIAPNQKTRQDVYVFSTINFSVVVIFSNVYGLSVKNNT